MEGINIAFPAWIERLPKKNQARARAKFLLRLAAVLATPEGSITTLSHRIGLHRNSLNAMLAQGTMDSGIPVNIIKAIEQTIGSGVIPRAVLNPEVYGEL